MTERTVLENWIAKKAKSENTSGFSRALLDEYQGKKLVETIKRTKEKSRFYAQTLSAIDPIEIRCIDDIKKLPFTKSADLVKDTNAFSCLPQSLISRAVTLPTSGTTGVSKRIYYSENDIESTIDFFCNGMQSLSSAGDNVLILLPGELPASTGELLGIGIERYGAKAFQNPMKNGIAGAVETISKEKINVIVGLPVQVLRLVESCRTGGVSANIKSILLVSDIISESIKRRISAVWPHCRIFCHYGMTEMGLGGSVQCGALSGYHYREADMFLEIVEPNGTAVLKDGEYGEVVFTSLTHEAMPLIRYRTGDISRFLPDPCPCGTVLRSLGRIIGRIDGQIRISNSLVSMLDFDEVLFALEGLLDYNIEISEKEDIFIDLRINAMFADTSVLDRAMHAVKSMDRLKDICKPLRINACFVEDALQIGVNKRAIVIK